MSEIRSVSVHLDADVAGYIAKMRLAGAETDRAFSRSERSIVSTNSALRDTESSLSKVDSQARRVDTTLRRVGTTTRNLGQNDFAKATSKVDGFLSSLGLIPALAIAGGAALVPLAAAATGVAAAFAAPIAFVGGGVTLFALLGGAAIHTTNEQFKSIDTLKKSVDSARISLEQAQRSAGKNASTSASVANAQDRLTKATHDYHEALKEVSPQQRQFHDSLETLQSDFGKFIRGPAGSDLLGPFTAGLKIADDLLPKVEPIIHSVSSSLGDLLGELDAYTQSTGFAKFVRQVSDQIGPDLEIFGRVIGDIASGTGQLFVILGKQLSPTLMRGLESLTQSFADWASSRGARRDVRSFVQYFHEVGPDVADTIGAVARALGHIVEALAPLGPPTLHVIEGISNAISSIPVPVLTGLAGAAAGLIAFQKVGGLKAISFGSRLLSGGGNPLTGGGGGLLGRAAGGVVPVFVTNEGFGGPGGGGGGGATGGIAGTLEKGAGAATATGFLARFGASVARFGEIIGAPAFLALADTGGGSHAVPGGTSPNVGTPIVIPPSGRLPTHMPSLRDIKATGTAFDVLKAQLGRADQEFLIAGNHAHRAFDGSAKSVDNLQSKIKTIKTAHASQQFDIVGQAGERGFDRARSGADNLQKHVDSINTRGPQQQLNNVSTFAQHAFTEAGLGADQLQGHINNLHGKQVNVTVNGGQSLAVLRDIAAHEAALRDKTITILTVHHTGGRVVPGEAAGGTVPGQRSPYGDKVLRFLAPGEEVISNRFGQADRNRSLLKRINARGMSAGGTVISMDSGGTVTSSSGSDLKPFTHAIQDTTGHLKDLNHELAAETKSLQKERAQRDQLVQARQQLVSTVQTGFRSDLFGVSGADQGVWAQGAAEFQDPLHILHKDIRDARSFRHDIRRLRRRGLSKAALAQITTLDAAEQVSDFSDRDLKQFDRLFHLRQQATHAAGTTLGNIRYNKQIAESNQHLKHLRADVHQTNQEIRETNHRLAELHKSQDKAVAKQAKATADALNKTASVAVRRRRGDTG